MILIERGPEPKTLTETRLQEVPKLARIAAKRPPTSKEIQGYKVAADPLWTAQKSKCCYCEARVPKGYNDVEHYRPKASANRLPGSAADHGYWWLAFTWQNLLFSCPTCNRSRKKDAFPLDVGSVALVAQQAPPGKEAPLLLDPAQKSGVPHIEFVFSQVSPQITPPDEARADWRKVKHWWPRARNGSLLGDHTIRVCGLDHGDQIEQYDLHVNNEVRDVEEAFEKAFERGDGERVREAHARGMRLFQPSMPYVALSYDALRALVPDTKLAPFQLKWPAPENIGRLLPRNRRGKQAL